MISLVTPCEAVLCAVHPYPLVEKDWVLRGCVSFTCGEEKGGRPFHPDVRSLGV
jgi:hypothetical protein